MENINKKNTNENKNNENKNNENIKLNNDIKEIFEICNEFLKIPSVTGFESPFLNYLNTKIKNLGYTTILNKNYLVVKNKNAKYLFSSHIDRQGFVLNENNKIEYAAFYMKKQIKSKFKRELFDEIEKELVLELNSKFENDRFYLNGDLLRIKNKNNEFLNFQRGGNVSFFEKVALRYVRENISSYDIKTGKIFNDFISKRYDLDIKNNEISFKLNKEITENDKIFMFNSEISYDETQFSAQIDNVISATVLYYILKNYDFNEEIIFTIGEEYGNSYNSVIEYISKFKKENIKLIVLDTSPYPNLLDYREGFITLRHGDENGGFDTNLVEEIKKYLELNNIPYDFKPSYMGKTELGRISTETNEKINGTTIQLPTMNYHTTYETATIKSLKNYLKIILELNLKNKN